jgi:hypothetical protein
VSSALLTFTAETHEYRLDGRLVPSVTTILRATGVSVDFNAIRQMGGSRRDAVDYKRDLGLAVHADSHALDDEDLDWPDVHPEVEPYLRAWALLKAHRGLIPLTRERKVYHAGLRYCGTLDGIFSTADGKFVLLDMKLGDPADAGCQYQTAAYELAYRSEHPDARIDERWGVKLDPSLTIPYRITPYTDWTDMKAFQAFVTTFYCGQTARSYR